MKKLFFFLAFFLYAAPVVADFNVLYDATTCNILEFGLQDFSAKSKDSNYGVLQVKEDNPLLKFPIETLKYDTGTKTIVRKTSAEITKLSGDSRKLQIRAQLENLLIRRTVKNLLASEGFDVSADLKAISNEITSLEAEYFLIP